MGSILQSSHMLQLQDHAPQLADYTLTYSGAQYYIWDHAYKKQSLIEYPIRTIDLDILEKQKQAYLFRHRHHLFVSTLFLSVQNSPKNVRVFYQRVLTNLKKITDLPFRDSLKFYYIAFKGFEILYQKFGYFEITQDLFFITQDCNIKVWCNKSIQKNYPSHPGRGDESLMVKKIIQIIESNTDNNQESHYPLSSKLYAQSSFSFRQANQSLKRICIEQRLQIPESLTCLDIIESQQVAKMLDNYASYGPNDHQGFQCHKKSNEISEVNSRQLNYVERDSTLNQKHSTKGITIYQPVVNNSRANENKNSRLSTISQIQPLKNITNSHPSQLNRQKYLHTRHQAPRNIQRQRSVQSIQKFNNISPVSRIANGRQKSPKVVFNYHSKSLNIITIPQPNRQNSLNKNQNQGQKISRMPPSQEYFPVNPRFYPSNQQNIPQSPKNYPPRPTTPSISYHNRPPSQPPMPRTTNNTYNVNSNITLGYNNNKIDVNQNRLQIRPQSSSCDKSTLSYNNYYCTSQTLKQKSPQQNKFNYEKEKVLLNDKKFMFKQEQNTPKIMVYTQKSEAMKKQNEPPKSNYQSISNQQEKQSPYSYMFTKPQFWQEIFGEKPKIPSSNKKPPQNSSYKYATAKKQRDQLKIYKPFSQISDPGNKEQSKQRKAENYRYKFSSQNSNQFPSITDISDNVSFVPTFQKIPSTNQGSLNLKKQKSIENWQQQSTVVIHDPNQSELKMPQSKVYSPKIDSQIFKDLMQLKEKRQSMQV